MAFLAVVAYGLVLFCVGLIGIVTARWELLTVFGVDTGGIVPDEATFLNQYRFLKAVELGAGVFCLMQRHAILDGEKVAAWPFLVIVAGGVAARSIAWVADGRPSWLFIAHLVLESIVLVIYLLHLRRRHAG
ncbi:MAG TPA: DUF4345 family protein [Allosphingosinicella sp.]|nr:DUF4345 family protein [Allosphingosinicella sp.]